MMQIVAARIGTLITADPRTIRGAVAGNVAVEFLDRRRMQFMAAMDIGPRWAAMADAPTLFCVDDNGMVMPPDAGHTPHDADQSGEQV